MKTCATIGFGFALLTILYALLMGRWEPTEWILILILYTFIGGILGGLITLPVERLFQHKKSPAPRRTHQQLIIDH